MSEGERLIYAAVWARLYDVSNPPARCTLPGASDEWEAWERDVAEGACEGAAYAVVRFREAAVAVAEGFGRKSDVAKMHREMRRD